MILDWFFQWVASVLASIFDRLPTIPAPPDLAAQNAALTKVYEWGGWINWYVPLDQGLIAFTITMGMFWALYGWRFLDWCLTKVHIFGGQST